MERARRKVDAHYTGRKKLPTAVLEQFEKKIRAYESQIVELDRELDPTVREPNREQSQGTEEEGGF